jgi:hypothetical protein
MAIYHFSAQMIKRSGGRSATAAAAYRAAENIVDRTTGEAFDYTRKGGVFGASILAPLMAPSWATDRSELWNQVEEVERRRDAQVAREIDLAIPIELNDHDRIELVRNFVQESFVDLGMVADVCFHDFESGNPHAHIMLTTREIGPEGFGKKRRDWNEHSLVPSWRAAWSAHANWALESAGFTCRIDYRSYEARGVDLIPTVHMGPAVAGMERRGISTRVAEMNKQIEKTNSQYMDRQVELEVERLEVIAEIERIRKEALAQVSSTGTFSFGTPSSDIADRAEKEAARYSTGTNRFIGDQYKAKLFQEIWQSDLDPVILKTLKWVDVDSRSLTLRSGEQIQDKGTSVSLSNGSDEGIAAAVQIAKAKGWESVRVTGSDDFQLRSALALEKAGIQPNLDSKIAKERFSEYMENRHEPVSPISELKPEPAPEPVPEAVPKLNSQSKPRPEPSAPEPIDIEALKDLVRRSAGSTPLKSIRHIEDDPKRLQKWADARWSELTESGEPEGLFDAFRAVVEEQAYMAGYSVYSVQSADFDGELSKSMPDYKPSKPARKTRPATRSGPRRTWGPEANNLNPDSQ